MSDATALIPTERIAGAILQVRGQKVLLDSDLAELYGVQTKALNQAVKRNPKRFPPDFMFQLTREEFGILKSQNVTSSWGGRRTPPYAFTEQGIAMLSSVLASDRAAEVNVAIMRAFVHLRQALASHEELARRVEELAATVGSHDKQLAAVLDWIRQQIAHTDAVARRRIGFRPAKRPKSEE